MKQDIEKESISRWKNLFTVLVITMPITNNYDSPIPFVAFGEFLFFISFILRANTIYTFKSNKIIHNYWLFFLYGWLISIIVCLIYTDIVLVEIIKRVARDFFYTFLIFAVAHRLVNIALLVKIYKKLVVFTVVYLFIQLIGFYVFSVYIPNNIPFIEFTKGTYAVSKWLFRPGSVFSEPAKFVHYVTTYLVLELFREDSKVNIKLAVIISVALLFSTSTNGCVYVCVIWIVWFCYKLVTKKNAKYVLLIINLFFATIFIGMYFYNNNYVFSSVINKMVNIGKNPSASGDLRILKGYKVFMKFPVVNQWFGIGFGTFLDFCKAGKIKSSFDLNIEYMNSLSYILVSTGILGLIFYLKILMGYFAKGSAQVRMLIVLLVLILSSSSIYNTPIYVVIWVLIHLLFKNKDINEIETKV